VENRPALSRRHFVAAAAAAIPVLIVRRCAAAGGPRRIAWLVATPPTDRRGEAFRRALIERGWTENRDFSVEWPHAFSRRPLTVDLVEQTAKEFAAAGGAIIVTSTTAWALAAQRATRTVPIVMLGSGFPVEAGIAASLGRPGGNVTGNTIYAGGEVFGKILQLLRDVRPGLTHAGVLWDYTSPAFPAREVAVAMDELKGAFNRFGVRMSLWQNDGPDDVDRALAELVVRRVDAIIVTGGSANSQRRDRIASLLREQRLPSASDYVLPEQRADRLLVYSPDPLELSRQAARYVDQISAAPTPES
jgi:putative ABC transport system substrate-binding protein